jgi:hypothetical protein
LFSTKINSIQADKSDVRVWQRNLRSQRDTGSV